MYDNTSNKEKKTCIVTIKKIFKIWNEDSYLSAIADGLANTSILIGEPTTVLMTWPSGGVLPTNVGFALHGSSDVYTVYKQEWRKTWYKT